MEADRALQRFAEIACLDEDRICLDEGSLEIARIAYPDLDPSRWLRKLDGLAERTAVRRSPDEGPLGFVATLNRSLFEVEAFRGNVENYYDPHNSYLNDVLDRRLGIPITLSVVYMEVARRLGFPVVGVGFPGHFVVRAQVAGRELLLDPFHQGRVLTPQDCQAHLDTAFGASVNLDPRFLEPVGPRHILRRMLTNLKGVYVARKDLGRALQAVDRLLLLDPEDLEERRERGKLRLALGNFHGAAEDLEAYLTRQPRAPDGEEVRSLIQKVRKRQALVN